MSELAKKGGQVTISLGLLIEQFCKPVHLVYLTCLLKKTRQAPQLSKLKMIGTKITTIIKGQLGIFIVFLFIFLFYSKALRCTFFGEWKNSCSSKFVQLELLNKAKTRTSKNRAAQGFHYINSCISNFFGPYSKTCIVKVRAA